MGTALSDLRPASAGKLGSVLDGRSDWGAWELGTGPPDPDPEGVPVPHTRTPRQSKAISLRWFAGRHSPLVVVRMAGVALETRRENDMTDAQGEAQWNVAEWQGKMLFDRDGEKIGKLQDVYVDVETDDPQFATVKEGFIGRHLTFVPLGGVQISPDGLQVAVTKEQVRSAPNIELQGEELSQADESALYHHFELNYTPISTESGRRLARR